MSRCVRLWYLIPYSVVFIGESDIHTVREDFVEMFVNNINNSNSWEHYWVFEEKSERI